MAPATKPTAPLDLKSASLTLVAVVLRSTDPAALGEELRRRVARQGEPFRHEPVVLDLGPLAETGETPDWPAVLDALRAEGLLPVAVKGGHPEQMAGALEAGLVDAGGGPAPARAPAPAADVPAEAVTASVTDDAVAGTTVNAPAGTPVDATGAAQPSLFDAAPAGGAPSAAAPAAEPSSTTAAATATTSASATPDPAPAPAPGRGPTVVIDRPLRSGQQVYARNADLVVMAVVSHGAEVIADGHIHVYAPLRGRAIAGARGDTDARIFAASMEPQLISIAGTWRTTETELPANVVGKPAQVRLEGDKLLVEPLGF